MELSEEDALSENQDSSDLVRTSTMANNQLLVSSQPLSEFSQPLADVMPPKVTRSEAVNVKGGTAKEVASELLLRVLDFDDLEEIEGFEEGLMKHLLMLAVLLI